MKCRLYKFSLPLSPSLFLMGQHHTSRKGLLLQLEDSGVSGFGEINPLPGLHPESLEDAIIQTSSLIDRVSEEFLHLNINSLRHFIFDLANELHLFPSVLFGLESALLHLLAQRLDTLPSLLLNPVAPDKLTVNALLAGEPAKMPKMVQQLLSTGCRTIKVKVGRQEIDAEIDLVKKINSHLPPDAVLRLDANQAWEFDEAVHFMREVDSCAIEYLEEPLRNPAKLEELGKYSSVKIALDESLVSQSPDNVFIPNNAAALVLKPAVLGGAFRTELWSEKARASGADVVISGSFCSSIGLISEAMTAAAFSQSAAGLGTWRWLGSDLLKERFAPNRYKTAISNSFKQLSTLDYSKLVEISD